MSAIAIIVISGVVIRAFIIIIILSLIALILYSALTILSQFT